MLIPLIDQNFAKLEFVSHLKNLVHPNPSINGSTNFGYSNADPLNAVLGLRGCSNSTVKETWITEPCTNPLCLDPLTVYSGNLSDKLNLRSWVQNADK